MDPEVLILNSSLGVIPVDDTGSQAGLSQWIPVLRCGKWNGTTFDLKHLREMAATFNPKAQVVPLKLDHVEEGPAVGPILECRLDEAFELPGSAGQREPVLLIRAEKTSSLLTAADSKQYSMRSVEVWPPSHPSNPTPGKWNLKAVALLGAAAPAVPGLGPLKLSADEGKRELKPYGDVEYADPGFQKDGQKRYPVDTEEHIRAAWSYIGQEKNASQYTDEQVKHIKTRIVHAWKDKIDKDGPPSAHKNQVQEDTMNEQEIIALKAKAEQDEKELIQLRADKKRHDDEMIALRAKADEAEVKSAFDGYERDSLLTPAQRAILEPLALSLDGQDQTAIRLSANVTVSKRGALDAVIKTLKTHGLTDPLKVLAFAEKDGNRKKGEEGEEEDDDEKAMAAKVKKYRADNPKCTMEEAVKSAHEELEAEKREKIRKERSKK